MEGIDLNCNLEELTSCLRRHTEKQTERNKKVYFSLCLQLTPSNLNERARQRLESLILRLIDDCRKVSTKANFHERKVKTIVELIVANFLFNKRIGFFFYYGRNPKFFKKSNKYNPNKIGYGAFLEVLTLLEDNHLIEHHKALRSAAKIRSSSCFRLDKKLESKLQNISDMPSKMSNLVSPINLIIVKDKNKALTETKVSTIKIEENLKIINGTNSNGHFSIDGNESEPPILKRVFNNEDLTFGGRFYSFGPNLYQSLKSEERIDMLINDEPVCELDFSSLHPNLLYWQEGIQLDFDPYEVPFKASDDTEKNERRKIMKKIFLIAINCNCLAGAKAALRKEEREKKLIIPTGTSSSELLNQLVHHNINIKDRFLSKNLGLKLQNLDSIIAEKVMLRFIRESKSAPILPVHDSFIIQARYKSLLETIMKTIYKEITNMNIEIKSTTANSIYVRKEA